MSETIFTPEQWRRAAERFSTSRRFVGHWLRRYLTRHGLTVGKLSQEWRTTPERLWQLSVFGVPRRSQWEDDLATLAAFCGVAPDLLAALFTETEGP